MNHALNSYRLPPELGRDFERLRNRLVAIGVAALVVCAIGRMVSADQFFHSYLWAYLYFIGLTLGCMAVAMLHHLTGGSWGLVIRRMLESAASNITLLIVLFLPILAGIPKLYPWSHADLVAQDPILHHKQIYLNVPFFLIRAAIYFMGWYLFARFLRKWSEEQDSTGDIRIIRRLQLLSGPGLVFYGLSMTFAAIDWVMSLDAHWFSTMFGLLFLAGQGLSAFAFMIAVVVILSRRPPFSEIITSAHLHDLGKLLLTFVMLWAYFAFSQYLIVWSGNLPDEIPWYLERLRGGWEWIGLALIIFQFALPFALLLSRGLKRNPGTIMVIACIVVAMRIIDLFWLVTPGFTQGRFRVHWMDLAAPIGIGGLWLAAFLWHLQARPVMPIHDPHLEEAIAHGRE